MEEALCPATSKATRRGTTKTDERSVRAGSDTKNRYEQELEQIRNTESRERAYAGSRVRIETARQDDPI